MNKNHFLELDHERGFWNAVLCWIAWKLLF